MANVSSPNNSDIQYYKNYFQQEYDLNLSEIDINDIISQNDPEFVFPELVRLAEIKKKNVNASKDVENSKDILASEDVENSNLQQTNNYKQKKPISLSINFHGFNVNSAIMFSRRILYDVDENQNYKIQFNVGRGSHSEGREKLRPEIEQVIRCINEKTNINISHEASRNPGVIALDIAKSNSKK